MELDEVMYYIVFILFEVWEDFQWDVQAEEHADDISPSFFLLHSLAAWPKRFTITQTQTLKAQGTFVKFLPTDLRCFF